MKYFTKDWYHKMQKTSMYVLLKIDERCNDYSEELYNLLYEEEKNKYVSLMSFWEDFDAFCNLMNSTDDTFKDLDEESKRKKFQELRDEEFGGLSLTEVFDEKLNNGINTLKGKLSDEILNEVKDIRVLALGYASSDVYNKIEKFCKDNEKFVNEQCDKYSLYEKEAFNEDFDFLNINWHDSFVVSADVIESDFEMVIDNIVSGTKTISFKNCNIILNDGNLNDCRWLYEEVYKINDGFEVHILVCDESGLKEIILQCSEVVVE